MKYFQDFDSVVSSYADESHYLLADKMDIRNLSFDHICFRSSTLDDWKWFMNNICPKGVRIDIAGQLIGGREIAVIKLHDPVRFMNGTVDIIEVPKPKPSNTYQTGWEHVEFTYKAPLRELLDLDSKYPDVTFDLSKATRRHHEVISLRDHCDPKIYINREPLKVKLACEYERMVASGC